MLDLLYFIGKAPNEVMPVDLKKSGVMQESCNFFNPYSRQSEFHCDKKFTFKTETLIIKHKFINKSTPYATEY